MLKMADSVSFLAFHWSVHFRFTVTETNGLSKMASFMLFTVGGIESPKHKNGNAVQGNNPKRAKAKAATLRK